MRFVLALILTLFAAPALAQGWASYENSRFGYSLDIPPGFDGYGESDNGDGQNFAPAGKPTALVVWGGNLVADFETETARHMGWDQQEAWNITYQATTPRWASYSGIKGSRILYQRLILLCGGTSYAAFRTEYSVTDSGEMDRMIERLARSLRGRECS